MEGKRIRVKSFLTTQEAIRYIQNNYEADFALSRIESLVEDPLIIPYTPPVSYATKPTLGATNHAGVPTGTVQTPMTPAQVNALAPGVVVQDKLIVGTMEPTGAVPRVFQNCTLLGTETKNILGLVNGVLTVVTVNAPAYAINNSATGTPVELYNCEVGNASKLMLVPNGAIIDQCYLHDGGEDGVYASVQNDDIQVVDTIISRIGNLEYSSRLNWTVAATQAYGVQIRGQLSGKQLTTTRVVYDLQAPGTQGAPSGDNWAKAKACVLAQTSDAAIHDVTLDECWLASAGSYGAYFINAGRGLLGNLTLDTCEWTGTTTVGPVSHGGVTGTLTVADNRKKEDQSDIDAVISIGGAW